MKDSCARFALRTPILLVAVIFASFPAPARGQSSPALPEKMRISGSSNGDPVFRIVDGIPLYRTGLAGFVLTFRGKARQIGMIHAGFFDAYRNRTTPRLEARLSCDSGRQAFDWYVGRQELPNRPYFGQRVFEVSGTVPKGGGRRRFP